jgi:phage-related protein
VKREFGVMSDSTYNELARKPRKPLVWLHGAIKTPPFSVKARVEAGVLLARLQAGESFGMPYSRPMPAVGLRCHELRVRDEKTQWRIIYRIDADAILVVEVFAKATREAPQHIVKTCKNRLARFDRNSAS